MAELNTSLYPQPPKPQDSGALNMSPLQALDLLGKVNSLKQFEANRVVGEEAQKAISTEGAFDTGKFLGGLRTRPEAAVAAPEAITRGLSQQSQNIQNATALFDQWAKQNDYAQSSTQSLLNLKNPTREDVLHWAVSMSRNADPRAVPSSVVNATVSSILNDPRGIKSAVGSIANRIMGPATASTRIPAPPGPAGEEQTMPLGETVRGDGGTMPIAQPPGEQERQRGAAEVARSLESTASTTAQYHADLDNLKQLSKVVEIGGPTVEIEKKLGQLASRFGLPSTISSEQVKGLEEFGKIANQLSLNQSKMFHGSDAGLHTVVAANPSAEMSRYGREGVIDMLQGNQDAIDVTRKMWFDAQRKGAPASSHLQFLDKLSEQLDPRVFQFNRLSRENQQKFLGQIDPDELPDFERKYQQAIDRKWVKPLKGDKRSAIEAPPIDGARKAPDGNWYVPDQSRPGKYMQVMVG